MQRTRKEEKAFRNLLYVLIVVIVCGIVLPTLFIVLKTYATTYTDIAPSTETTFFIDDYQSIVEFPQELNGDWISYEGVYIRGADELASLDQLQETKREMPENSLYESKGTRTYKVQIDADFTSDEAQGVALGIENASEDIRVYINGIYVPVYNPINSWIGTKGRMSMYPFIGVYDESLEFQEIVISSNASAENMDMYRRVITLTTMDKFVDLNETQNILSGFMVGLMIISIILCVIYIIMLPTYSVLTFMNLFDVALMLYIFYMASGIPTLVAKYYTGAYNEAFIRGQTLMLLFLAGFTGNILGQVIYDPERESYKIFDKPVNTLWVTGALIFGLYPQLFTKISLVLTVLLLIFDFIGLLHKITICYMSDRWNGYLMFHMYKTIFVGIVIMYDVCTLNTYPRNTVLILTGYCVYFSLHFFIRAYEYRIPFRAIEKHNEDLEKAVQERTEQLTEANQFLRDMNTKDTLTKAHNRLYFEELLLEKIEQKKENDDSEKQLYLCIFDLDNFKNINDTYGHSVGDDQLIEAVKVVNELVPPDVKVSRIGGEEFTLLFESDSDEKVLRLVEGVRDGLEVLAQNPERTTGSFGVSKYKNEDTRKVFFINADRCLYHSKESGKNCITYDFDGSDKLYKK